MHKPLYRFSVIIAIIYLIALALTVFWPTPVDRPISGTLTQVIRWLHDHGMPKFIGYNKIEFAANIALFIPMGFIAATWLKKAWVGIVLSALASLFIEIGQALWLPNRFPSTMDIVANTLGGAIGVGVLVLERKMRIRKTFSSSSSPSGVGTGTLPGEQAPIVVGHGHTAGPSLVGLNELTRPRRKHSLNGSTVARAATWQDGLRSIPRKLHTRPGKIAVLLLAVCFGAAAHATFSALTAPAAPEKTLKTTPPAPIQTPSPAPTPAPSPTPPSVPPVPQKPVAAFVGDDYTVGVGATARGNGWADVLASQKGWDIRNLGHKSTGYVSSLNGNPALAACDREACPRYGNLIDRLKSMQPSVVVVSGGRNDVWQDASNTAAEIDGFYHRLAEALPQARIVVVTPVWDASTAPESLSRVSQQVKMSAASVGAQVIDIGQPLQGRPDRLVASGTYPNDAGHRAIADAVVAALNPPQTSPPASIQPSATEHVAPSSSTPSGTPVQDAPPPSAPASTHAGTSQSIPASTPPGNVSPSKTPPSPQP